MMIFRGRKRSAVLLGCIACLLVGLCFVTQRFVRAQDKETLFPASGPRVPLGLPPIIWPSKNKYTPEKAELGWLLFFDKRLSADGTLACASCHQPENGFTDGRAVSTGMRSEGAAQTLSIAPGLAISSGMAGPNPWKSRWWSPSPIPSRWGTTNNLC